MPHICEITIQNIKLFISLDDLYYYYYYYYYCVIVLITNIN